jgi:hypothetical protein
MSSRAVKLTTPIPTLDQVGERLGLSKARRETVLSIVRRDSTGRSHEEHARADIHLKTAKKSAKK